MSRVLRAEWLLWVLVWCAARACLLLSFADVFGYGEELEKACAAKAMLDGLAVPHHQLAYHYYEGGGFVVSHLDALAFLALGPSLLAVKLVALALGAAALAAGWLLCERAAGRGAARAFACLFTFAPATLQQLSLLALGIHFHALIFVALTLAGTLALFESRGEKKRVWFATGLAAGFGLYFSYVLVLTVAVCAAALVLGLRRELVRPAARAGLVAGGTGFLIGFAPWLLMFAEVGAQVFDVHGTDVVEGEGDKGAMLGEFLASVFVGRSPADLAALVVLLASPLIGGFAFTTATADGTRRAARLLLAHGVVFAAAYLAGGFTVGRVYHYFLLNRLTPLWWFAVALTALGAAAAWRTRVPWKRAVAALAIAAQVAFGMLDLSSLASSAQPGARELPIAERTALLARMRGYDYGEYIRKIAPHLEGSQLAKTRVLLGFREDDPTALHAGIAIGLGDSEAALTVDELLARARESGVEDVRGFLLGCGVMLRKLHPGNLAARAQAVAGYPEEQRDALYEALGNQGLGLHPSVERLEREIRVGLEHALPESYFRGVGRRMYRVRAELDERGYAAAAAGPWAFSRERAEAFVATQPAQVREALLAGFDAARRADTLP